MRKLHQQAFNEYIVTSKLSHSEMVIMNNAHDLHTGPDIPYGSYGQGITLEPFLHQVSGRATMMCLNETTVCKPLNYREHFFYKSLPPDILQFTPRFKGVVNVNIEEAADGSVILTAYPYQADEDSENLMKLPDAFYSSEEEQESESSTKNHTSIERNSADIIPQSPQKRIRLKRTGSVHVDFDHKLHDGRHPDQATNQHHLPINPWIFKVYKEGLRRQLQSKHRTVQKCILLENVTYQFRRPCVLDLKMGTRFHGDYDDDDKKMRHERKCAATTTQKLGLRLSGMQVYHRDSGKFLCRDKYFGRTLDKTGLRNVLHQFFFDGRRTRRELLTPVLKRLRSIRDSLRRLPSYRFYSSSLLVMYDGDSHNTVDVSVKNMPTDNSLDEVLASNCSRLEDHCVPVCVESCRESESKCKNVVDAEVRPSSNWESCIQPSSSCDNCEPVALETSSHKSPAISAAAESEQQNEKCSTSTSSDPSARQPMSQGQTDTNPVTVDIRMIDFAKATNNQIDSSFIHDGPDHGYIFGLTNLIKILKEISKNKNEPDFSYFD
ncbi:inositol hexakisphosphate kinase 1-like isoform X2 [Clavelina lepadiformis]|uniref:inositol hexakisphosphate kinase 1-like isoform X2 n=1 Tax=Clavelina lepadiformis TaxID=159417 RepID=UPI0040420DE9